jgi:hypothetical protein
MFQLVVGLILGIVVATVGINGLVRMGDRAVDALKTNVEKVSTH